jgi:chorismate-pyruvate lyase
MHGRTGSEAAMPRLRIHAAIVATALSALALAHAQESRAWPDTFVSRLEALALMQTLNAEILGSRSATATLEAWCRDHRLAAEPRIVALVVPGMNKAPSDEQRRDLEVERDVEVKYRHVQLRCGANLLSEADNWYVPARLTAEMNRLLDTTDTPFGKAVESLQPYRRTIATRMLWTPLPDGWELRPDRPAARNGGRLAIPDALFEHRAILYTRGNTPFSEVREVYQRQILAFPPPSPR